MRLKSFDLAGMFCTASGEGGQTVAVDIDDASLQAVGQWPWPRGIMARLVERLGGMGVRTVVFAVVFAEPDRLSPPHLGTLPGLPAGVSGILGGLPDTDQVFANSLHRIPVVLAQMLSGMPARGAPWRNEPGGVAGPVDVQGRFAMVGPDSSFEMPGHTGLIDNIPVLRDAAAGAGVAALVQDADGVVRRFAAIVQADGRLVAGLGPEAVRVAEKRSGFLIEANGQGAEALRIGEHRVPVDASGFFRPKLCGLGSLPVVRAVDVLERGGSADLLRDRIAVVGVSARGVGSLWRTASVKYPVPSAILEAGVISDVLRGQWLQRPVFAGLLETLAMVGGVMAIGRLRGHKARCIASLGLILGSAGLVLLLMWSGGLLFDWTLPVLGLILAPLVAGLAERRHERGAQRRRDRFMRHIVDASPDPILAVSGEGTILSCNSPAAALGMCPQSGLHGTAAPLFGLAQADLRYLIQRCLAGVPVLPVEVAAKRTGGEAVWLELAVGALDADSVILIGRDITRRKEAQTRLAHALADNEALLREVHHRVRNNLQGIWGVIALEKSALTGHPKALERLSAIQDRLLVLGRIHEQLARTGDLARIDVKAQVEQLCRSFTDPRIGDGGIVFEVAAEPLGCHIETAMPLGLIINELVSERLKDAFPDMRHGKIAVRLGRSGETVVLEVADDGAVPWPEGAESVGNILLAALVGQLEAVLESGGAADHRVRVILPGRLFD